MTRDSVTAWLDAAGRFELLTKQQMTDLALEIQTGPPRLAQPAMDKLYKHNLRLVPHVWQRQYGWITHNDPRIPDLLQEGAIGLRTAVERFDPERASFSTFAVQWIRQGMNSYLRSRDRTIRVSSDAYGVFSKVRKLRDQAMAAGQKQPTLQELAAAVNRKPSTVADYLRLMAATHSVSADLPVAASNGTTIECGPTLIDNLAAPDPPDLCEYAKRQHAARKDLEALLEEADLTAEQLAVLRERMLMGTPRSYDAIAQAYGISSGKRAQTLAASAMRKCQRAAQRLSLS